MRIPPQLRELLHTVSICLKKEKIRHAKLMHNILFEYSFFKKFSATFLTFSNPIYFGS